MKRNFFLIALIAALASSQAFASSTRTLDGQAITNGAALVTLPASTTTLVGTGTTDTLTGKTMSGASNTFSAIPVGSIGNGSVLSGTNTGDVTASAFGATPNANGFTLTGQAFNLQPADATHPGGLLAADWATFNAKLSAALTTNHIFVGASGVATDVAMSGDATIVASGALTLATVNSNVGSFTNANITVDAKGRVTAAANGSSSSPALNGTSSTPQSVTASGGVSLTGLTTLNEVWVVGSPGAVTVTATPSITACTADGQQLKVHGTDNTKTVKLQDQANLSSSGLSQNGDVILAKDSTITYHCDITQGLWVEDNRR